MIAELLHRFRVYGIRQPFHRMDRVLEVRSIRFEALAHTPPRLCCSGPRRGTVSKISSTVEDLIILLRLFPIDAEPSHYIVTFVSLRITHLRTPARPQPLSVNCRPL